MFEDYKINRKKHRIQWAMILIIIQIIIILFIFRWLKNNYHKWTWNPSTKEGSIYELLNSETKNKTNTIHAITDTENKTFNTWDINDYTWLFGSIQIKLSNSQEKDKNLSYDTTYSININSDKIYSYFLLKNEVRKWILDKWIFAYIINNKDINIETTIDDLRFLIQNFYLDKEYANKQLKNTLEKIKKSDRDWIIQILNQIEKEYNDILNTSNTNNIRNNFEFTNIEAFEYVRNQLVIDAKNRYADTITSASKKFNIDEDIIRAVIFTEQLRWFTTYRWIFKSLVASNKYLMIMSQFSYGLWGIKEKSAIEIENRYKISNENLYNEIFKYPEEKNIYSQRISRLTSVNDYYYQIMYVAWCIAMYRDQRIQQWYDIWDKIWIMTTLYNIGYKKPNNKPEVWWANIKINWQSLSFWKISTSIFYIIKSNRYN